MELWDKWKVPLVIVAALILIGLVWAAVSNASAADKGGDRPSFLPISDVVDKTTRWTGVYVGVHAGYGWAKYKGTGVYTDNSGAANVLDPETGKINADGAIGGIQAGFNIQSGPFVYGIEGDFSWSGIRGQKTFISDYDNANQTSVGGDGTTDYTWNIKTDIDWIATLRGRVGALAKPNLMIYGTGGVAFASIGSHETVVGFPPQGLDYETTVLASSSETAVGWVAGAGAEWAVAPHWTVKTEWQYLRFDDVDTHFVGTAYPERAEPVDGYSNDSFPGDLGIHTVRVGVNYKFGK